MFKGAFAHGNDFKEIINLDFWDKSCDDPKCEYCHMRETMNKKC